MSAPGRLPPVTEAVLSAADRPDVGDQAWSPDSNASSDCSTQDDHIKSEIDRANAYLKMASD